MSSREVIVFFACLIAGAFFGAWRRSGDLWGYALGIACGVTVAFAYIVKDPWFLLALLLFVPLTVWRRRVSAPRE